MFKCLLQHYIKRFHIKLNRDLHIKEITKLHKELESDQKNQIQRLTKENKELTKKEEEIVSKADSKVSAPKILTLFPFSWKFLFLIS